MKKLLVILGTITIAGSGMTGIVGNAPVLTKNEINYLKRSKRDYDHYAPHNYPSEVKKIIVRIKAELLLLHQKILTKS